MQIMGVDLNAGMILFPLLFYTMILNFPFLFIMHLLMPKKVLQKYFKPPHFSETEIAFFTGPPYCMVRTVMFMGVFSYPHKGEVRKMTEAYLMVPLWYRKLSKFYVVSLVVGAGAVFFVAFLAGVYYTYMGKMDWT